MLPKVHFLLSISLAFIMLIFYQKLNPLFLIVFILSNLLLDIDHFFYYACKKKKILSYKTFKEAYSWYKKDSRFFNNLSKRELNKYYFGFYIFHGIEFIFLLFILGLFNKIFFFIFLGFLFHYTIDLFYDIYKKWPLQKFSWIYSIMERKKKSALDIRTNALINDTQTIKIGVF